MAEAGLYEQAIALLLARAPVPKTRPPRASATVVPWRRRSDGAVEVFWVKRAKELGFLGGWHAFPGGALAREDAPIESALGLMGQVEREWEGIGFGIEYAGADATQHFPPGLWICAVRELFEETGILLARGAEDLAPDSLAGFRAALVAEERPFESLLKETGAVPDPSRLVYAGRWITPPISPIRFDNRVFLLEWDRSELIQPRVDPGELEAGEWIDPAEAVAAWRRHEVFAAPPTLYVLAALAGEGPDAGLARLRGIGVIRPDPLIDFLETRPGIIHLPVLTATLPPAKATNLFLVGADEVALVDVGTPFDTELERLETALDIVRERLGKRVTGIWLTHHHPDHVWGLERIRRHLGVPVWAHPVTAEHLACGGVQVDELFHGGERVTFPGSPPRHVRVLHTPGHARGHLCFFEEEGRSLIAGDLVAGIGTIVIDPPEGNMSDYLDSLERVAQLAPRTLLPSHGPMIADAAGTLAEYRRHRLEREENILALWNEGARDPAAIVARVYRDVSPMLHPIAERQVRAHLERLDALGRIRR